MALKLLVLRKKVERAQSLLAELRAKTPVFQQREAELEAALNEAKTDADIALVETEIEKFNSEKQAHDSEAQKLESEIAEAESEISELAQAAPAPPAENNVKERNAAPAAEKREENRNMDFLQRTKENARRTAYAVRTRTMAAIENKNLLERKDVEDFLTRVRGLAAQKRTVTGAELAIPKSFIGILRDNTYMYSKFMPYVNKKTIKGAGRQIVNGTVPEAVWTEMCARLNELNLFFNAVEVDGFKVGGFIPVCNALLQDSDIDLATEILDNLGRAIAMALDKAVAYGKGVKMPLGFVTRLAQTEKPSDYSEKAPEWKDLHLTNLLKLAADLDGKAFFKAFIKAAGAMKSKYSDGQKIWCMNETTYTDFISRAIEFNAAGAAVSLIDGKMPIIGGDILILDFVPDGDILGAYASLYILAEREGVTLESSEHVMFIEDNTVFKGIARYDGKPSIAAGFIVININNIAPTTVIAFAPDTANEADGGEVEPAAAKATAAKATAAKAS